MELWKSLLFRGIETEGQIGETPASLKAAYEAGKALVQALSDRDRLDGGHDLPDDP